MDRRRAPDDPGAPLPEVAHTAAYRPGVDVASRRGQLGGSGGGVPACVQGVQRQVDVLAGVPGDGSGDLVECREP